MLSIIPLGKAFFFKTKVIFNQGAFKNIQGLLWKIQGLFEDIPQFFNSPGLFKAHANYEGTHFKIWSNLSTMATLKKKEESTHCSPLSPKSDQHQFSPNNTNALSKEKGVRINTLITKKINEK